MNHVYTAGVLDNTKVSFTDLDTAITTEYLVANLALVRNDLAQVISITDVYTATGIFMDVSAAGFTIDETNKKPIDSYGSLLNVLNMYLFKVRAQILIANGDASNEIKFQGVAWRKEFIDVVQDRPNERVTILHKGQVLYASMGYAAFTLDAADYLPFSNYNDLIDALDSFLRSSDNTVKCFSQLAAGTTNEHNLKPVPGRLMQIITYYLTGSCCLKIYDTDKAPVPGEGVPVLVLPPSAMGLPAVFSPAIEFKKGIGITITAEATIDDNKPADNGSCVVNIVYQ